MFLMCLKADPPFREEKTDLIHPVSRPHLGTSIFIYLLCDIQASPFSIHKSALPTTSWLYAALKNSAEQGQMEACCLDEAQR